MMTTWKRVTTKRPCGVCKAPDWCTFAADDGAACCMRVESPKQLKNGGYLHKGEANGKAVAHTSEERPPKAVNWEALATFYAGGLSKVQRDGTAAMLGVTVEALARLRMGFDGLALTFPMVDAKRQVVGIRRRTPDGSKTCVPGSRSGMFAPADLEPDGPLFVCEGESDCAAILGLGVAAIGRPGCNGGIDAIVSIAGTRVVVIIPDNDAKDSPAMKHSLASIEKLRSLLPDVRVVWPPVKDARAWCAAGLTRAMLERAAGL